MQCQLAVLDEPAGADDGPAVAAAFDKLAELLAQQKTPPKEVYRLALEYGRAYGVQALKLHRLNALHAPKDDLYALWSQTEIVKAYIRDGNEPAAEQALKDLTDGFAEQPTLSTELARVADTYAQAGQYNQADQLYRYIRQHWSNAEDTLWARVGLVRLHISKGEDDEAEASFRQLRADYANDASLPQAVEAVAEAYRTRANAVETEYIGQLSHPGEYAHILAMQGRPEAVKRCFRRAIEKWQIIIAEMPQATDVTASAYVFAGECCEKVGDHAKALEYFHTVVERYPDYEYAPYAQFMVARAIDHLQHEGQLSREDAVAMRLQAAQTLLDRYPQSEYAPSARQTVERIAERQIRRKELQDER